jgi:hypothetical protein
MITSKNPSSGKILAIEILICELAALPSEIVWKRKSFLISSSVPLPFNSETNQGVLAKRYCER